MPPELRLYQLVQIGLSLDEAEDGPAVRNDWLLHIHQAHLKAQNDRTPPPSRDGTVTRPLGPPGG